MSPKLNCREATRLLLVQEDRELTVAEKLALKLHLTICDACTRFVAQVEFMKRAKAGWRRYRDSDSGDEPPAP